MKRLSRTTLSCGNLPLSRVCGCGSRPGRASRLPGRGRTWVYEGYGVKQAQEWLGHSDPATTLRHYVRLTTAARAKVMAGLDEVTRAALERAEEKVLEDARPLGDNVVALASRR
jgi:integrase